MGKIAYQYDYAGVYAGETIADESQKEPGHYHLPARSTLIQPPDEPAGQRARWNGAAWELITMPEVVTEPDAVTKLQVFLANNPDVADLIK